MKKRILAFLPAFFVLVNIASAQGEENLKLHFDFSQVEGNYVTDAVGGIRANLVGAAKVEQLGKYSVLNLGDASGYLNMTYATGAVIRTLKDFSVSACYRVNDSA